MTLETGVMADENSALHHRNKLHFKIYYNIIIIYFLNQINAALANTRDYLGSRRLELMHFYMRVIFKDHVLNIGNGHRYITLS